MTVAAPNHGVDPRVLPAQSKVAAAESRRSRTYALDPHAAASLGTLKALPTQAPAWLDQSPNVRLVGPRACSPQMASGAFVYALYTRMPTKTVMADEVEGGGSVSCTSRVGEGGRRRYIMGQAVVAVREPPRHDEAPLSQIISCGDEPDELNPKPEAVTFCRLSRTHCVGSGSWANGVVHE